MAMPIDVNFRAVRVADEFELVEPSAITARIEGAPDGIRPLLTPPVYYSLASGIADNRAINDAMLAAARRLGTHAFGVAEPKFGEAAAAEIERLARLGAAGLVWSPRAQGLFGNDHSLAELVRHASGLGLVSMVQATPYSINEGLWRLWSLAGQIGDAPLVVLGAFEGWEAIQFVRENKGGPANILYDLSAISEGYDLDFIVGSIGFDRLLFGSGGGDGVAATQEAIARSNLPAETRDAIFRNNAARLFSMAEAES